MKETSFKAGVIGGVFTFLALFATTSKASINESAATNGDSEKGGLCVLNP